MKVKPTAKSIIIDWLTKRGNRPFSNTTCITECSQLAAQKSKFYSATTWVKELWNVKPLFVFTIVENDLPETWWKARRIKRG